MEQVENVPSEKRKMVADHQAWAYFAEAYGFELVGTVIPSYSTLAEPSAKEVAALEESILALEVSAVFVGNTVNPDLSSRIAEDTGIELVSLFTGSLSGPDGPAADYISFMQHNVRLILEAVQ